MTTRRADRSVRIVVFVAFLWIALIAASVMLHAGGRMTARVIEAKRGRVTLEAHLTITERDRTITAVLDDGENFHRSSAQQTWPTQATYRWEWYDVPAGQYDFEIYTTDGIDPDRRLASVRSGVMVSGR